MRWGLDTETTREENVSYLNRWFYRSSWNLPDVILNHLRPLVSAELVPYSSQPGICMKDAVIYLLHRPLSHLWGSCSFTFPVLSTQSSHHCSGGSLKREEWSATWLHGSSLLHQWTTVREAFNCVWCGCLQHRSSSGYSSPPIAIHPLFISLQI